MYRNRSRPSQSLFMAAAEACRELGWCPPADVYRISQGWLIKFDLAGVKADDVELTACGRCLTVRGIRRDRLIQECEHSYSMEISYSRFERSIELPEHLDGARISTEFSDGMLLVRLVTGAPEG